MVRYTKLVSPILNFLKKKNNCNLFNHQLGLGPPTKLGGPRGPPSDF
jgi:hypothetical protein